MEKVMVKKLDNDAKIPNYAHNTDAGVDLYSVKEITLKPMQRALVPTGIAIALPDGFEAQVRPKSGLALKYGITVLNTPGTIDQEYRGEIGVIVINLSDSEFKVEKGMKIAQMVFSKVEHVSFEETRILDKTERGEGGFGSTGLK